MTKIFSLPLNIDELSMYKQNVLIDMSDLHFPVAPEKQVRAAFIFIRNSAINKQLDFSKCSYEYKAAYLLLYMQGNIILQIPELIRTWIVILGNRYSDLGLESIMSQDELDRFCDENKEYVYELRRVTISLPLISIKYYHQNSDNCEIIDDTENSDFDEINYMNFSHLLDYDEYIWLSTQISDIQPVYYTKIFDQNRETIYSSMINKFPYLDMMNLLVGSNEETKDLFIKGLEDALKAGVYENDYTIPSEDIRHGEV